MTSLLFLHIGFAELLIILICSIIALLPLALATVALIDLFRRNFEGKTTDKIVLIILILFAPFIGSLVYIFSLRDNYSFKHS